MLGKKDFQSRLIYDFSLEEVVPQDDFYRQLQQAVDLSWVRSWAAPYYSNIGRPSLDPEVFVKIELIGYLEGISSERQLMREIHDRLSLRRYIGYDIDESVPDHSTLSKTRTLLGKDLCGAIMNESVRLCTKAGMVGGVYISGDKSLVKANASLASLEPRIVHQTPQEFVERVFAENSAGADEPREPAVVTSLTEQPGYPTQLPVAAEAGSLPLPAVEACQPTGSDEKGAGQAEEKKEKNKKKKEGDKGTRPTNATYVSRTDPEAELASRPDVPAMLAYAAEFYVDSREGVIVYADATRANLPETATVGRAIQQQREVHKLSVAALSADKGYGKGQLYHRLEEMGVVGFIPHEKHGNPASVRGLYRTEDFVYDRERGVYICPAGRELRYSHLLVSWPLPKKVWRAEEKDCQGCALGASCTTSATGRTLQLSIFQPCYERMDKRLQGPGARLAAIARRTGPERAFAQAKDQHGLRRAKYRGLQKFRWQVLLTAAAMNLKKYVKWVWRKVWGAGRKRTADHKSSTPFAITSTTPSRVIPFSLIRC